MILIKPQLDKAAAGVVIVSKCVEVLGNYSPTLAIVHAARWFSRCHVQSAFSFHPAPRTIALSS